MKHQVSFCLIVSCWFLLGDLRNDLYLTFHSGEFERGMSDKKLCFLVRQLWYDFTLIKTLEISRFVNCHSEVDNTCLT